jgi:hypothetical protein
MAADVGGDVHRADFLLRQLERREHRPLGAADAEARRAARQGAVELRSHGGAALRGCRPARRCARVVSPARWLGSGRPAAPASTSTVYSPAAGSRSLPCTGVCRSRGAAPATGPSRCTPGWPSSSTSTARRPAQKSPPARHQRVGDVQHQQRDALSPNASARPSCCSARTSAVVQPALHDDAQVGVLASRNQLVQAVLGDVAPRGRDALLDLELFVAEGHRRVRQPHVVEAGRLVDQLRAWKSAARLVVLRLESCRAHGRRGCAVPSPPACSLASTEREGVLDHVDHHRQVGPRVEQASVLFSA